MSILEIFILAAAVISIFSLGTFLLHHQKKNNSQDGYTYWFENVDELL